MAKPKKGDVIEQLEKAKIAFDPTMTVDELVALLPKEPEAPAGDAPEAPTEPEAPAEGDKGTKTVYNTRGQAVRTYSKENHGADYAKLAKEYAEKIGGSVK